MSERVGEIRSNARRTTFTGFRGNIVMGNDRVMISISPEKSLRSNCNGTNDCLVTESREQREQARERTVYSIVTKLPLIVAQMCSGKLNDTRRHSLKPGSRGALFYSHHASK